MHHFVRKVASRAATVVGTAVIVTVVVAGSLSVAQAATEAVANNSVNSAKIVDNSVQSVDIKNNSITSADILNSTVTGTDIADGTISAQDLSQVRPVALVVTIASGQPVVTRERGVDEVVNFNAGVFDITLDSGVNVGACYVTATINGTDSSNGAFPISAQNGGTFITIRTDALPLLDGMGFTVVVDC